MPQALILRTLYARHCVIILSQLNRIREGWGERERLSVPNWGLLCPEIRAFTGFGVRFLRQSLVTIKYYLHPKWPLIALNGR